MVAYSERLQRLGYSPAEAEKLIAFYISKNKLNELAAYIDMREDMMRSISEHITEVLG